MRSNNESPSLVADDSSPFTESFPKGFLLASKQADMPEGFVPGPLLDGLSVSRTASVQHAGTTDVGFVIIIGTCIQSDPAKPVGNASDDLLDSLQVSESQFLKRLDDYAGRHVIIYGSAGAKNVVSDATGMRSVFYAAEGGAVASHAFLVETALGGTPEKSNMPFRYGHPGNLTPYSRTKILTPNTLYRFDAGSVERFWPRGPIVSRTAKDVALETLMKASTVMRRIASERPVKMALTAGLDSRALLAVMLHSGIDFEAYTYGNGRDTLMDRNFAVDLAAQFGLKHTIVSTKKPSPELQRRLNEAHYTSHHQSAITPLSAFIGDSRTAATTANLLEIGRSFYKSAKKVVGVPVTGSVMNDLHFYSTPRTGKEAVTKWGEARYVEKSVTAFNRFIKDTDFEAGTAFVDPYDLFYWEHRMGTWHGASMVERDFYAEPFIPFNTRGMFEAALGVPQRERDTADVFHEIIRLVDPALVKLPVNPKVWPPTS